MTGQPSTPPPNDPDRTSGSLIADAHAEFVAQQPGGAFDPRTFRARERGGSPSSSTNGGPTEGSGDPTATPVNDERMSGPGAEIDKAG